MNSARITSLALAGLTSLCLTTAQAAASQVEKLYWSERTAEAGFIRRCNLDGSDMETVIERSDINPADFAVHKSLDLIFICDFLQGVIYRSNLNGEDLHPIATDLMWVRDITIDEKYGKVYFVQLSGKVGRVGLDGQNLEILHVAPHPAASYGVAVDDKAGYFYYNYFYQGTAYTARGNTSTGVTTDVFQQETWTAIEPYSPDSILYFNTEFAGINKTDLNFDSVTVVVDPPFNGLSDLAIDSTGQRLFASGGSEIYLIDTTSGTMSLFRQLEAAVGAVEIRNVLETNPDPDDLICLTQFEDVWFSINDTGKYESAVHANGVGFQKTLRKQTTVAGDFNADGLTDLAMVTPLGELWFAINQGINGMAPTIKQSDGWAYNDQNGIFAGDFDGDGFSDILQIATDGTITVGWNTGGQITTRTPQGTTAYQYSLQQEFLFRTGDVDNDGNDEIIHFPFGGDVTAHSYDGTTFVPSTIAMLPEAHTNGFRVPVLGDFNGDHLLDLAITPADEDGIFVGLRHESGDPIQDFTFWSPRNGLKNGRGEPDPTRFWWLFAADVNGDEKDDLVQLNDTGEIWIAPSTGSSFLPPYKDATLGFEHNPDGPWLLFVGNAR